MRLFGLLLTFLLVALLANSQSKKASSKLITGGIQYKPIFPVGFLGSGHQKISDGDIQYDVILNRGFNGGAVIRRGLTELLAIETGISYVKRTYKLTVTDGTSAGGGYSEASEFRVIGYEIPVSLLVYIRLGENVFMNTSMGVSPDLFASSVGSQGEHHQTLTVKNHVIQPAILANVGWEYRTLNAGTFYLGSSFHRPFGDLFVSKMVYENNGLRSEVFRSLSGAYLTFDIRYFFPASNAKRE